jgi:hypothetical protein
MIPFENKLLAQQELIIKSIITIIKIENCVVNYAALTKINMEV